MRLIEDLVLLGPNRRGQQTLVELWLEAEPGEEVLLAGCMASVAAEAAQQWNEAGAPVELARLKAAAQRPDPFEAFAALVAELSLALQRAAGHRVGFVDVGRPRTERRCWVAVEHECSEVGLEACALALRVVADRVGGLNLELAHEETAVGETVTQRIAQFLERARQRVLPRETQAIIDAAARADVPCVKLDRAPYEGVSGPFRIRPNGLLKLGQGHRQRVLDGGYAIDSPARAAALLFDRSAVCRALDVLDLPRPAQDPETPVAETVHAALRCAERLGYPVTVRPREAWRTPRRPPVRPSRSANELLESAEAVFRGDSGLMVESWVSGQTVVVLVADGEIVCAVQREDGKSVADVTGQIHPSIGQAAVEAARRLEVGLLSLTVVSPDSSSPLDQAGAVVDLDVAPSLDALLPEQAPFASGDLMARAADGLVRYLYPAGSRSRIPIVSITGTNGKTTTTLLVGRMLQQAGYRTGRASTTGVFIDDSLVEVGDLAGSNGHHRVLENPEVQAAALETAYGGVAKEGLMFDGCDVAVYTNLSQDHLGPRGVETIDDMGRIKELIVDRARDAIVLNADDPRTLRMLPCVPPRQAWLTSVRESAETLRARHGEGPSLCTVEVHDGSAWIMNRQAAGVEPVLPLDQVPMTFGGRLRFNVANALQATAAALAVGVPIDAVRAVLSAFQPGIDTSPGRMNFYRGLPFTVLLDYAHNPDGHRQLADFVQTLDIGGRRILHFSASGSWSDEAIREQGRTVAGRYDLYLCRDYPSSYEREPGEVGALIREGLLDAGVPEEAVVHLRGETTLDTLAQGLALCRPNDLLVFSASTSRLLDEWATITSWKA